MGNPVKKQYLELGGKPVLTRTLEVFEANPQVQQVVPVVAPEDVSYCWEATVKPFGLTKVNQVVAGGCDRTESVWKGLQALDTATRLVLVHDGVRPFVPVDLVTQAIAAAWSHGAAVLAVPVKETIKMADESDFVASTPDRRWLWASQTPQAFSYDLLLEAYRQARAQGPASATDDAMLVEALGYPVKLVPGVYRNLKITTGEDLAVARALLEEGGA